MVWWSGDWWYGSDMVVWGLRDYVVTWGLGLHVCVCGVAGRLRDLGVMCLVVWRLCGELGITHSSPTL